jgi:hypothetical protein
MPDESQEQGGTAGESRETRSRGRAGKPPVADPAAKEPGTTDAGDGEAGAGTDAGAGAGTDAPTGDAGDGTTGDGGAQPPVAPRRASAEATDGIPADAPQAAGAETGGTRDADRKWSVERLLSRGHNFIDFSPHDIAGALSGLEKDAELTLDEAKAVVQDWLHRPEEREAR